MVLGPATVSEIHTAIDRLEADGPCAVFTLASLVARSKKGMEGSILSAMNEGELQGLVLVDHIGSTRDRILPVIWDSAAIRDLLFYIKHSPREVLLEGLLAHLRPALPALQQLAKPVIYPIIDERIALNSVGNDKLVNVSRQISDEEGIGYTRLQKCLIATYDSKDSRRGLGGVRGWDRSLERGDLHASRASLAEKWEKENRYYREILVPATPPHHLLLNDGQLDKWLTFTLRPARFLTRARLKMVEAMTTRRSQKGLPPVGCESRAEIPSTYIGWTGFANLGDEACLEAVKKLLPWTTLSVDRKRRPMLVLGGGTLIYSGKGRSSYLPWIEKVDGRGVKRVVLGTGVVEPTSWQPTGSARKWVSFLDSCDLVGVRGPASLELLGSMGYGGEARVIGDPALLLQPPSIERREQRVLVNVLIARGRLWGEDDDHVLSSIADFVRWLRRDNWDVHLLACSPEDNLALVEILRRSGSGSLPTILAYNSISLALREIAKARFVIAERLHGSVLAAACNTPFLGLEYRSKVRDFSRSIGQEELVIRTDALSSAVLKSYFEKLLSDEVQIRADLAQAVGDRRRDLFTAANEVKSLSATTTCGS